jgi:hypothetical protein
MCDQQSESILPSPPMLPQIGEHVICISLFEVEACCQLELKIHKLFCCYKEVALQIDLRTNYKDRLTNRIDRRTN